LRRCVVASLRRCVVASLRRCVVASLPFVDVVEGCGYETWLWWCWRIVVTLFMAIAVSWLRVGPVLPEHLLHTTKASTYWRAGRAAMAAKYRGRATTVRLNPRMRRSRGCAYMMRRLLRTKATAATAIFHSVRDRGDKANQ